MPPTTLAGLSAALEACTPDILRLPSWRGQGVQWRVWLGEALSGPLRQLGLVALSGEGEQQVVTSALLAQPASAPSGPAWVVQPNFELVVYPAQLNAEGTELLAAAEALRFDDHSASYRLSRESVYTALCANPKMKPWKDKGLETVALSTRIVSVAGCTSICRQAFEFARKTAASASHSSRSPTSSAKPAA